MKTKISHRFLSLFAAVLVAFSLISTVALAAEIQPRIPSCPNGCTTGYTYYANDTWPDGPYISSSHCSGKHCRATVYRCLRCSNCGASERVEIVGYKTYCNNTGVYF